MPLSTTQVRSHALVIPANDDLSCSLSSLQAHNRIKIRYLLENPVLLEEGVGRYPQVAVHLRLIIIQEGLLHMDHVVEGEILGAEGLWRVLLQI